MKRSPEDMREAARERSKKWRTLAWSLDYTKDKDRRRRLKWAAMRAERITRGEPAFKEESDLARHLLALVSSLPVKDPMP